MSLASASALPASMCGVASVASSALDPRSSSPSTPAHASRPRAKRYAAEAPEAGSFTPARDLLDAEAQSTCHRWQAREEAERERSDQQRREDEARREHVAREHQRDEERRAHERERLSTELERNERMVATCDASEAARAARKRHAEILDRAPGATVRKSCTPRFETRSVKSECKDANGFAPPCTQTVSTGDVSGYACPKTLDAEVVQLGLYQLDPSMRTPTPKIARSAYATRIAMRLARMFDKHERSSTRSRR